MGKETKIKDLWTRSKKEKTLDNLAKLFAMMDWEVANNRPLKTEEKFRLMKLPSDELEAKLDEMAIAEREAMYVKGD